MPVKAQSRNMCSGMLTRYCNGGDGASAIPAAAPAEGRAGPRLQSTHLVEESRGEEHPCPGHPLAAAPSKHGLVEVSVEGGGRGTGAWVHACSGPPTVPTPT